MISPIVGSGNLVIDYFGGFFKYHPARPSSPPVQAVKPTGTPKVCKIIAFWAGFSDFGLLFYLPFWARVVFVRQDDLSIA